MIDEALKLVQTKINKAAKFANRESAGVHLVAVSKNHGAEKAEEALLAGHRVFGENRVQEAQQKWPDLKAKYDGVELHLIGSLQTNKAKDAVALFDVIETIDRAKLARVLAREMAAQGKLPKLYIQVNTGEETQKAGVLPDDLADLLTLCQDELGLSIEGLMCIPPVDEPSALHFALLAKLAKKHGLPKLSMGMSSDYEAAIGMGAHFIRVGTAIFGERPPFKE
jgi:hypothetical protein